MLGGGGNFFDPFTLARDNTRISAYADPEYRPRTYYFTDALTDQTVRFLREHDRDHAAQPLFLYLAYTAAHWPMHALPEDITRYKGRYDQGYEPIRRARFEKASALGLIDPRQPLSEAAVDWASVANKPREAACMEVYAAMVDRMDQGIGKIVAELKRTGRFENTLILFLQDNGGCAEDQGRGPVKDRVDGPRADHPTLPPLPAEALIEATVPRQTREGYPVRQGPNVVPGPADSYVAYGRGWANVSNTPFREYKHWVHEGGISTPLVAHWPAGIQARGEIRKQPGHVIDVMATCLDVSGAAFPVEHGGSKTLPPEGRSLLPAFAGRAIERDALYWEHEGNRAVREGDWKLVAKGPDGPWELYDLAADRVESKNLATAQPERVARLQQKWESWARRAGVLPWIWKPAYGAVASNSRIDVPKDTPSSVMKPFGLSKRVPWTTSRMVGSPDPPDPYRLERVFPKLKFKGPVCIAQEPGTDRLVVAEYDTGKIYAFARSNPNVDTPELFHDAKRMVYAFSFHPKYEENGQVFVFSPSKLGGAQEGSSRVSRFETNLVGPRRIKPETETVIIEWPAGGHNGGEAIIGPDGYLYVCTGDGTSGSDGQDSGQGVNDLHSVMMRLDIDHPDPGRNYSIPKDNPFIEFPGARPEIWSFGFRNPWRMSFDAENGRLWVGDVGQDLWEMVRLVRKGDNHGWSVQEGSHLFQPHRKAGPGPIVSPVVEHHHTECRSITGGYVYYGQKFPELRGAYLYGDYQYGKIWGLRYDGQKVTWHKELADTAVFITSFAVSRDGEVYVVDNSTGFIHALRRTPPGSRVGTFPRRLSETGVFTSVKDQRPAPGVLPYSVKAPQWADGAHMQRWLALPGQDQITEPTTSGPTTTGSTAWTFPDGTVVAQTLSLALDPSQPGSRIPVETRVLLKQDDHVLGYSYRWNEDQTDATLVGATGEVIALTVKDPAAPGGQRRQSWRIPGRNECMFCHSRAAGFVLGLNANQLNSDHNYEGVIDNQLRALDHAGALASSLSKPSAETVSRFVNPYDDTADLNDRARTYLHVNCSTCHVNDGGGNSFIELDRARTLAKTKAIDSRPVQGMFGIDDARIIAPGEPERSVLYYRISSLGSARMPRVGSRVVDHKGADIIYEWIRKLPPSKPEPASPPVRGKYAPLLARLGQENGADTASVTEAIRTLTSSTSGALALARAYSHGELSGPVREAVLAETRNHPQAEVRDIFERFVPESERLARLGEVIDPNQILNLQGDPARGRALFADGSVVNCKNCHRLDGVGVELGPDLSKIGAKYQRPDLLREILEPSRTVDPKYTVYSVSTRQGLIKTGLLVDRNEKQVVVLDAQNEKTLIATADVEAILPQKPSLMPELLLRGLTPQQAADLLEYLVSLR
jgi:uncharacterized repeat protein (TIGR03806 family)